MKKILTFLIGVLIVGALSAQTGNSYRYPITIGMGAPGTVTGGSLILKGLTSGTATIRVPAVAGTGTIFQLPATNGTTGYLLQTNGSGVTSWLNPDTRTREIIADSLSGNAIQLEDVAVMLLPDTVAVTSSRVLALTDAGKRLRVTGTHITLTLPPSTDVAFPKETTIYVKLMSASTVLHFAEGAGVKSYAVGDSANGNTQYKWYGIIYWDHDNYELIGVED
jgi:hypothetical protein